MPMLMVNLDCSDSQAAASTSILCPIHKHSSSREGSQVSRGWLCGTTTSKSSAEQEQCGSDAGSALQVERATHDTGSDFVKAGKRQRSCMIDNKSQMLLMPTTTTTKFPVEKPIVLTNTVGKNALF